MKIKGLDELAERIETSPQMLFNGDTLSHEERSVIDPRDTWFVALVNALSDEELKKIGKAFSFLDDGHYMKLQKDWFKTEKYLMKSRPEMNGKEPDDLELIRDAEKHRNMERYRLCYILQFPHKVAFNMQGYILNREEADEFIAIASKTHRIPFPYYEQIWCNSLLNQLA